jgi:hypothetical protein
LNDLKVKERMNYKALEGFYRKQIEELKWSFAIETEDLYEIISSL